MRRRFQPFLLSFLILALDQLTKAWVVATIAENSVGYRLFGDFLEIWHVRNTAIAFSMGTSLEVPVKIFLFVILPAVLLGCVAFLIASGKEVHGGMRWILALFLGGGMGNLCDRIFRHLRVVDFMANRVYGLFGMEFWPTWNLADASLVVSGILLVLSLLYSDRKQSKVDSKKE